MIVATSKAVLSTTVCCNLQEWLCGVRGRQGKAPVLKLLARFNSIGHYYTGFHVWLGTQHVVQQCYHGHIISGNVLLRATGLKSK
jgi:hypothetical protein